MRRPRFTRARAPSSEPQFVSTDHQRQENDKFLGRLHLAKDAVLKVIAFRDIEGMDEPSSSRIRLSICCATQRSTQPWETKTR